MNNSHLFTAVSAFALGALAMYILDPQQGRRRRALARDQLAHAQRQIGETAAAAVRDLRNRAYGLYAETRGAAGRALPHREDELPQSVQHLGR